MLEVEDRLSSVSPHPMPCASATAKTEAEMVPKIAVIQEMF